MLANIFKNTKINNDPTITFPPIIEQTIGYLHLAEIQKINIKELKRKSGIFVFLLTNIKLDIGSSINLYCRFNNHIIGSRSNIFI